MTDSARNGMVPLNPLPPKYSRIVPGIIWKSALTVTVTRRSGSFEAGPTQVIEVGTTPAELHTVVTRVVTAATSGPVTTASLQPSRAADVSMFTVIQARPNSVIPKRSTSRSGRMSANSITD